MGSHLWCVKRLLLLLWTETICKQTHMWDHNLPLRGDYQTTLFPATSSSSFGYQGVPKPSKRYIFFLVSLVCPEPPKHLKHFFCLCLGLTLLSTDCGNIHKQKHKNWYLCGIYVTFYGPICDSVSSHKKNVHTEKKLLFIMCLLYLFIYFLLSGAF